MGDKQKETQRKSKGQKAGQQHFKDRHKKYLADI